MKKIKALFVCFILFFSFQVHGLAQQEDSYKMNVHHMVRQGELYVDVYVSNFEFCLPKETINKTKGQGYLVVTVDGERVIHISKAAFVIKDLKAGVHQITLSLVYPDGSPYGVKQQLTIQV